MIRLREFAIWGCSVWLFAGCQPPAETTKTKTTEFPLTGQTVRLLVPGDLALKDLWEPLLQEWRAVTGGNVAWSEYDLDHPPWGTEGDPSESGNASGNASDNGAVNGGTLVVLPLAELADAEEAGWLSPLPAGIAEAVDNKDLFPGLKEAAVSRQKRLVAVPVSAPVLLCYYRKDLLEAAGRNPPQTWDEYLTLVDELPQWAPGLTALEPCGPQFRTSLFLARSVAYARHPQNYSVWFDIQTGNPLFDSPAFVRALDGARDAWNKMPAEIWEQSPLDCRRELLAGRAAMALTFEPATQYPPRSDAAGASQSSAASPSEPLAIGAVQLPGTTSVYQYTAQRWENVEGSSPNRPGYVGFTGLAMGVRDENDLAAAWNLLQTLAGLLDQAFAQRPRSVCRESEAVVPLEAGGELSAESTSRIVDAAAETLRRRNVTFELAIPGARAVRETIAAELESAKDQSRPSAEILAAIQEQVSRVTEDRRERLRDHYRRSVGLAPMK